jgi:MerR family transcriptional regulator, copper efflux regulator
MRHVYARRVRIGELARQAETTPRTIRYYEGLGLLAPARRHGGGHRHYDDAAVHRLRKIDWLKDLGLTLDEIREVIPLYFADGSGLRGKRKVLRILERRLAETEERIEGLEDLRDELRRAVAKMRDQVGIAQT